MITSKKYIISICLVIIIAIAIPFSAAHAVTPATGRSHTHQTTVNPQIPLYITFAGKSYDIDRLDMYERLDRELTSLLYGHGNMLLTIKRANRYAPMIIPTLRKYGIPSDLFYLAAVESYFNPRAYSPAGAAGIWQFIPETAKLNGLEVSDEVDERYDPERATVAACKYLKKAYAKYGDWPSVMASYNGGMSRISRELNRQSQSSSLDLYLTEETSRYVFRIFAMKIIFENPSEYGFILTDEQLYQPIDYKTVEISGKIDDWSQWAKKHGISYAQLRDANPWIRKHSLTNKRGKTYKVHIPLKKDLYRSKREYKTYNKNWTVK